MWMSLAKLPGEIQRFEKGSDGECMNHQCQPSLHLLKWCTLLRFLQFQYLGFKSRSGGHNWLPITSLHCGSVILVIYQNVRLSEFIRTHD
uniref:Uncharacterized protein n=1 Tax=Anguilla anguilla TaxID=7936 RepID=A0A0E9X173_ANGAN